MIIGISGRKGAGKDTAADDIAETMVTQEIGPPQIISFAGFLKRVVATCFLEDRDLDQNDQAVKNTVLPNGKTIREIQQYIGTDIFREIDNDCWIRAWKRQVEDSFFFQILVPDVRYPNEVKAIQDMGGKVLRLTRCPHPEDEHESETALDDTESWSGTEYVKPPRPHGSVAFDRVLDNSAMTIPEQNEAVWDIIKNWI